MLFEADEKQIRNLDDRSLVQLMKRLVQAECRTLGIPLREASVPVQITVPDGGEDGRVEWNDGADGSDYFPSRFCVFQFKAGNVTTTSVRKEVLAKGKRSKPVVNPAVAEVLARSGAYVLVSSYPFGGRKVEKLREEIRKAIRETGEDPNQAKSIDVYDANQIATWVNTHPGVALWLASQNRRRSLAGFMSHSGWGRAAEIKASTWTDDGKPRFAPLNAIVPAEERVEQRQNAWTFEQAAEAIHAELAGERPSARVVGPSGFGKSRFVYEIFNRQHNEVDAIDSSALVYADLSIAGDEVGKLALEIADSGAPAILVVDECSDTTHNKLVAIARRSGSLLRIVTLDVETAILESRDTLAIRLEPAADAQIRSIAKAVSPSLSDADLRLIEQLSEGFPQMAVLAAQCNADRRQTILSAQQILDRIIWDKRPRNDQAQKALEIASLFEWFGTTERADHHARSIAHALGRMPDDTFLEYLRSFQSRGIIGRRGDYLQVEPVPLAVRLASHRLSILPAEQLDAFFAEAPRLLKNSLLRRFRWLDTVPEAKAFSERQLSPSRLGNREALSTDLGAECLDRLVHVDPDRVMETIDRVFSRESVDNLSRMGDGRRHLVWALEKLAFRRGTFHCAATMLRRLAAAETEPRIANNATGQFNQLFHLYLSGTEVEPFKRMAVLDEGLASADERERAVCVEALGTMLQTHHFSRGGGSEEIGSAQPLKDWLPATFDEIREFYRAGANRLCVIAIACDPLAGRARKLLGSSIRGLLHRLPLEEIKGLVQRVTDCHGFWPEAVKQVNEWLYFDRGKAPDPVGAMVRGYFDELMPQDPVELAVLYTHGWSGEFYDPDCDFRREQRLAHGRVDYAERMATELASTIATDRAATSRTVARLAASEAKAPFAFAKRLAELVDDPATLFRSSLGVLEAQGAQPNRLFFAGLVAGADSRDAEARHECLRAALESEKLKGEAISLIAAGRLKVRDLDLVVSMLESGDISPFQCAALSYGQAMDHLTADEITPFLVALQQHGTSGLWAVLEIVSMYLYGGKQPLPSLVAVVKDVLIAPALFDDPDERPRDGHRLGDAINLLVSNGFVDANLARALVKQLLSLSKRRQHGPAYSSVEGPVRMSLELLAKSHSREMWKEAARLMQEGDLLAWHRLSDMIGPSDDDFLGGGILFDLPAPLYLDWARNNPAVRARLVLSWLPVATRGQDGLLRWHPSLESFVLEFGSANDVLRELAARLLPRAWAGSLVPHLKDSVVLLRSWEDHPLPEVQRWVREQVGYLENKIRQEEHSDAEECVCF